MTKEIPYYESVEKDTCQIGDQSCTVEFKKTSQGYARKRTLKPGGSFICGGGAL
jgi:hypothetical protein